jgi:O-antigen/teichoic acid export membrane protein
MSLSNQFWSTFIRVLSLAGKAALLLILAKELEVETYGAFGLITVTIGFAIYLLGFEFYTHSVRSIIGLDENGKEKYIRDHLVFILLGYLLWLPLAYIFVLLDIIPTAFVIQFYCLLILEHLSAEIYRLLVAFKKPVSASTSFFIRNASWA